MKPEDRKVLIFLAVYLGWLGFVLGVVWILESAWPLLLLIITPRLSYTDK